MASTLEDAALGRAVHALADAADQTRTFGLLCIVSKTPAGWQGQVRMVGDRPFPFVEASTLAEVFEELAALIPDDKEDV